MTEFTVASGAVLREKLDRLEAFLKETGRTAILFSGGLDSTLLAFVAFRILGEDAAAITVRSPLMTQQEFEEASAGAARIGISHHVIEESLLGEITKNTPERCYICRKGRHAKARLWADKKKYPSLADGANLSDLDDFRPGMKAAGEDGIIHPLLEAGLTKEDVRALSRHLELPGWDRESFPCLATRFPYGAHFKKEDLAIVEKAERYLRELGLKKVRVRVYPPGAAVVEISEPEMAWPHRELILDRLTKLGYPVVSLDLEGFVGGKMNRFLDCSPAGPAPEKVFQVEATIDDMTGEEMGRAIERIREKALEANIIQGQGKKGRPAWILQALASEATLQNVLRLFLEETSSLGVRFWPIQRIVMERKTETRTVLFDGRPHSFRVKVSRLGDLIKEKPESDDVGRIEDSRRLKESENIDPE
ncbi:MAG: ATP-dependent sacrificial sulfur transferase LarE [Thermovirgaceae bacterium]|nr:ATP-dependent sacrificial sulfur transferase LarE [Thermovirgaceae bacterium]